MVPPDSGRVSRAPPYSGCCQAQSRIPTGLSPAKGGLSIPLRSLLLRHAAVLQPRDRSRFGLFPVRSPLLGESRLMSSPPATWMFRFAGLASPGLCVRPADARIAPGGLSHSDSRGSMAPCASPRIFAACRVLLRRRMPRHPPCALSRLIPSLQRLSSSPRMSSPAPRLPAGTPSSFFASLLACFTFLWNCFPVLSIVRRPRGAGENYNKQRLTKNLEMYLAMRGLRVGGGPMVRGLLLKGGNPAAPSGTATLLRLSPSQRSRFRRWLPCGSASRLRALPSSMA